MYQGCLLLKAKIILAFFCYHYGRIHKYEHEESTAGLSNTCVTKKHHNIGHGNTGHDWIAD